MYPAPCVSVVRKSRTSTAECCWLRTVALQPQVIRATAFICVTRPTSKYQTARILFGRGNGSKWLQGWFVSAVWTCRRFPKTKGTSLLSATTHAVSRRCAPIIGTSAVKSMMHSILVIDLFFLSPNKVCAFVRTACWVRSAHGFFKRWAYIADGRSARRGNKKDRPEGWS